MKHAITFFYLVILTATASAVEYVTLRSSEEHIVDPTSLVELSAQAMDSLGSATVFKIGGDSTIWVPTASPIKGFPLFGITKVRCNTSTVVTLKITTAEELNPITSGIVTLPAETGQGYTVTLEQSTDLINFSPVAPGSSTGAATPQFFRVHLNRTPAP